jgi:hypothetical protein
MTARSGAFFERSDYQRRRRGVRWLDAEFEQLVDVEI